MAIVPKGSILDGMRGRLGDMVFRVQGDRTIVSHRPRRKRKAPVSMSPSRKNSLTRFQQAVEFARDARQRSAFRSLSRLLGGYSPYHVALQDFLSEPVIESISCAQAGEVRPGEYARTISIHVSERIAIRSVRIRRVIRDANKPSNLGATESTESTESKGSTGLSTPPVAHDPGSRSPERRLPPAATFFKKVAPPAEVIRPAPAQAPPAQTTSDLATSPASASASASTERVVRACRVSELDQNRDLKNAPPRIEIWQARLTWTGEIEIVASDYAGNRAIKLVQINDIGKREFSV